MIKIRRIGFIQAPQSIGKSSAEGSNPRVSSQDFFDLCFIGPVFAVQLRSGVHTACGQNHGRVVLLLPSMELRWDMIAAKRVNDYTKAQACWRQVAPLFSVEQIQKVRRRFETRRYDKMQTVLR